MFSNQGSEVLQKKVEDCLERIEFPDALINCSGGRDWDEQHCWFSGHFIKSRNLTIHYDYMIPLGIYSKNRSVKIEHNQPRISFRTSSPKAIGMAPTPTQNDDQFRFSLRVCS